MIRFRRGVVGRLCGDVIVLVRSFTHVFRAKRSVHGSARLGAAYDTLRRDGEMAVALGR